MISIIIPIYNAGAHIERCLASLQCQTGTRDRHEIIVVDDGSTDGSGEQLRQRGITVIWQPNRGPAAARNAGAAVAKGEILLFIDADCRAHPAWLAEMLAPFADAHVVGVVGAYQTHQASLVAQFVQLEFEERYRRLGQNESVDFVGSYAVAFRRDSFLASGGFHPQLVMNEDVELAYRIYQQGGKIVFNPRAIVYHQHPETLAQYFRTKFGRGLWRAIVYQLYPQKSLRDAYTPQMLKMQVFSIYILIFLLGLSLVYPQALGIAVASILVSSLSMGTFCLQAWRKSRTLGLASLPLLWVRALALALGTAVGGPKGIRLRRKLKLSKA